MLRPQHELAGLQGRMTPSRMAGIGFVVAFHIALVFALLNGFAKTIVKELPHSIQTQVIQTPQQQPTLPPPPVQIAKIQPTEPAPIEPVIDVQAPPPQTALQTAPAPPQTNAVTDAGASGLTNTHTTPPYPPDARRLGQQGVVVLALAVSQTGAVTDAKVAKSSGTDALDQTAINWVMAHWKYKPAIQNGVAVPSTTQAAVKFDLKQAH